MVMCVCFIVVARSVPKAPVDASLILQHLQKFSAESGSMTASKKQRAVVVVKSKRRSIDKIRKADAVAAEGSGKPKHQRSKKQKVENLSTSVVTEKEKPRTAIHGLVSYCSDSDSDGDGGNTAS